MADRAGKNVRYNSPPRRVADPLRGRYVGRRIEFPAATRAIIDAERAEANARGEIYLIPLRFMPENEYIEPPANLQRNRRHEPAYLRANRAAARAAAAAEEEEAEAAAAAAAAPAAEAAAAPAPAVAVAAPAVAVAAPAPAVAVAAPAPAPAAAALAAVEEAVEENNNNNNFIIRRVKRSRPGNISRKGRKGRKNRKSRKSRH